MCASISSLLAPATRSPALRGRCDADEGIHASGSLAVAPERMKLAASAHRAEMGRVDALRRYTGLLELVAILCFEIEMAPARPSELRHHFRTDFVAARADA